MSALELAALLPIGIELTLSHWSDDDLFSTIGNASAVVEEWHVPQSSDLPPDELAGLDRNLELLVAEATRRLRQP